jgi:ferric-dicitrate binding protein FerR (iron transport regulator)
VASPSPAHAQAWRGGPALAQAPDGLVQSIQWRRYPDRYYHRRHRGWGPAIGGFAAGAIVGGALAAQQAQQAEQNWLAYCSSKYRSFDPETGTYMGYDGRRHYCR